MVTLRSALRTAPLRTVTASLLSALLLGGLFSLASSVGSLFLRPIVRMRLFVVVAARAAEEEQNFLSVLRHFYGSELTTINTSPGLSQPIVDVKLPIGRIISAHPNASIIGLNWGGGCVPSRVNMTVPTVPNDRIALVLGGCGFALYPANPIIARSCPANALDRSSKALAITKTTPLGVALARQLNNFFVSSGANSPRLCELTVWSAPSSMVCKCSESANSAIVNSCSPRQPTIAAMIRVFRYAFHFSENSSAIHERRNSEPNTTTAPRATYCQTTVADLDSDKSVPIDPYSLSAFIFVVLEIVVVAALLIRRVLKGGNDNSD